MVFLTVSHINKEHIKLSGLAIDIDIIMYTIHQPAVEQSKFRSSFFFDVEKASAIKFILLKLYS